MKIDKHFVATVEWILTNNFSVSMRCHPLKFILTICSFGFFWKRRRKINLIWFLISENETILSWLLFFIKRGADGENCEINCFSFFSLDLMSFRKESCINIFNSWNTSSFIFQVRGSSDRININCWSLEWHRNRCVHANQNNELRIWHETGQA